jgi:hypothetical protein
MPLALGVSGDASSALGVGASAIGATSATGSGSS